MATAEDTVVLAQSVTVPARLLDQGGTGRTCRTGRTVPGRGRATVDTQVRRLDERCLSDVLWLLGQSSRSGSM